MGLVAVPPSGPLRDAALRLAPHPAQEVSLRGGFVDAGDLHLGGSAGPRHVLRLELEPGQGG